MQLAAGAVGITRQKAIIDAGSKTPTPDLLGLSGYGHVLGRDDIVITRAGTDPGGRGWIAASTVGHRRLFLWTERPEIAAVLRRAVRRA